MALKVEYLLNTFLQIHDNSDKIVQLIYWIVSFFDWAAGEPNRPDRQRCIEVLIFF